MGVDTCKSKTLTWGVDPCLISKFELSGHWFGTILKSFILAFQSASSSLVPLNIVLVECKKRCFRLQTPRDLVFLEKKAPGTAAPHRIKDWEGPMQASVLHGSIFRKWTDATMQTADPCTYARRRLARVHFPSSENLDDMILGCARVPKIIPMHVQGGLRGSSRCVYDPLNRNPLRCLVP